MTLRYLNKIEWKRSIVFNNNLWFVDPFPQTYISLATCFAIVYAFRVKQSFPLWKLVLIHTKIIFSWDPIIKPHFDIYSATGCGNVVLKSVFRLGNQFSSIFPYIIEFCRGYLYPRTPHRNLPWKHLQITSGSKHFVSRSRQHITSPIRNIA